FQAARAMRDAAAMAQAITQAMSSQTKQQIEQQSAQTGASTSVPDVMTPAEAAAYLRVSEDDVMALIESGELKARRIGSQVRISKAVIDEFLKG
ncbi:MAG: helix-turn-helix domain-containing protein, partial [Anaerolineae bacterium]|nr:helix-turn-helix domain-containing protein [Anaerolineae bacterium]